MARLTRKELLAGAAAAGVVAGCGGSPKPPVDPRGWAAVKAQFALSPDVRHFDAFVLATHPRTVREAIERHRRGLDADPNGYLRDHEAELDQRVLEAAGRYLGVPGDFALTDSTTMGLGLVYGTLRADGEAVATEHDFYATHEALRLRFGRVRKIRLYDDPATATTEGIVEAVRAGIDGDTGILALTWVHSSTGVRLPLREIADSVGGERRNGMLVVVDGVHALGAVEEPVGIESFDVLAAGCHKWLGGPRGTGIVWSIKAWERMQPVIPSFDGASYLGWLREPAACASGLHGRRAHAGRLPQLRAPLGAGGGVRLPGPARAGEGGGADPHAGHAPQGGPRRPPEGAARHADVACALGRDRLLRRRRDRPPATRSSGCEASTASARRSRRTRPSMSVLAPDCGSMRRTSPPRFARSPACK